MAHADEDNMARDLRLLVATAAGAFLLAVCLGLAFPVSPAGASGWKCVDGKLWVLPKNGGGYVESGSSCQNGLPPLPDYSSEEETPWAVLAGAALAIVCTGCGVRLLFRKDADTTSHAAHLPT